MCISSRAQQCLECSALRRAGVLTKLDIMDRGTDALRMLRNEVLPLRLGYTAVINRSQADIRSGVPVAKARAAEAAFFSSTSAYKGVSHQCGISALSQRCARGRVRPVSAIARGPT